MAAVPGPVLPSSPPPPAAAPAAPGSGAELAAACARLSDLLDAGRRAEVLDLAGTLLPRAQAELGDNAPLVRTVRTIYARTLHQERRYRQALPEYRLLAATADGGPHGPQALEHRYRAAECLERSGQGTEALAEYRALLDGGPGLDPERAFDARERIGLLLAAGGESEEAWQWLLQLLFDRERREGPHHPAVRRLRQALDTLQPHRSTNNPAPPDPRAAPWPPTR